MVTCFAPGIFQGNTFTLNCVALESLDLYFEEMRVLQAGICHEYVSME